MKKFSELTGQLKTAPMDELRKEAPGYLEFVLTTHELPGVYPILEDYFGPPFKPAGMAPSKEATLRTADYGGIEKQQTLYYVEDGGISSCAMIWPWQDKVRATVKVAQGETPR